MPRVPGAVHGKYAYHCATTTGRCSILSFVSDMISMLSAHTRNHAWSMAGRYWHPMCSFPAKKKKRKMFIAHSDFFFFICNRRNGGDGDEGKKNYGTWGKVKAHPRRICHVRMGESHMHTTRKRINNMNSHFFCSVYFIILLDEIFRFIWHLADPWLLPIFSCCTYRTCVHVAAIEWSGRVGFWMRHIQLQPNGK